MNKLKLVQNLNKQIMRKLGDYNKEISILEKEKKKLEYEIIKLKDKIKRLSKETKNIGEKENTYKRETKYNIDRDEVGNRIGKVFIDWCKSTPKSMVDRHNMFSEKIKNIDSKYTVSRIFRDKNSAGTVFYEDVQDAVEYWLVGVKGRNLLLPQPQRNGFNELGECFIGDVNTIKDMKDIYPAEIYKENKKWIVKRAGVVQKK